MSFIKKSYKNTYDIVIGGMGIAGLTALHEINNRGLKKLSVIALEAKDRVGGRILYNEYFKDIGAAGFHLPNGFEKKKDIDLENDLPAGAFEIIKFGLKRGIKFHRGDIRFTMNRNGKSVDPATVNSAINEIENYIYRAARDIRSGDIKTDMSLETALVELAEKSKVHKALINSVFSVGDSGLNAKDISVEDNWNTLESTTPIFPDIGMGALVERYAKDVKKYISFSKEITNININKKMNYVEINYKDSVTGVEDAVFARKFIPTFSIGVWQMMIKENRMQGLPKETEKAIMNMQMGHLNKVILRMHPFFFEENGIKPFTKMVISSGRLNSDAEFLMMPMGEPIIVRFIGGDKGLQFEREKSWAIGHTKQMLASAFDKKSIEENFENAFVTSWDMDPHTLGSYAAATIGNFIARTTLTKPIEGLVFPAGEACLYPEVALHSHMSGGSYSAYKAVNDAIRDLSPKRAGSK